MRRERDVWPALGCGAVALSLYLRTLAPGVLFGDPAEFQTAAWGAGLAHPTGYPFFLLAGWAWMHLLPLGEPAWRLNLLSALLGATAVGVTCLATLRLIAIAVPSCSTVDSRRWPQRFCWRRPLASGRRLSSPKCTRYMRC